MWLLILLCVDISAAVWINSDSDNSDHFRKCCDRNQILKKITEQNLTMFEYYECVELGYAKEKYNVSISPLFMNKGVDVQYGMPSDCESFAARTISNPETELYSSENTCYDRLVIEIVNGSFVENIPKTIELSCNKSEDANITRSTLKLNQLRKCCPIGQQFDTEYHVCRESFENYEDDSLFKDLNISEANYIYEVGYGLRCKFDEYALELTENFFSMTVMNSSLLVVNKSDKEEKTFLSGEWCVDRQYNGKGLIAQTCSQDCKGFGAYCLRKCCPQGHHFRVLRCGSFISECVPDQDDSTLFNISTYTDPLRSNYHDLFDVMGIRIGLTCPTGRFGLDTSIPQDQHRLRPDAHLESGWILTNTYCLEMFDRRDCPTNDVTITAVLCFQPAPDQSQRKDYRISSVIITISSVCLGLTLIVYCALPELRNLNGRNLICHVSMMLLAFSCLARVQHSAVANFHLCTFLGYGIYFGFVAAFAWLNVMCFDIWWTFGSVRTVKPLRKSASERRRFIWYSLYAWGITVLLTLTMFLLDRYPVSIYLDANIGSGACWFGAVQNTETDWPHYIFFVVPMGIVTCTNFILWMLTARYCAKVKSEVHRLQAGSVGERVKKRFRIDRAKYILTGKLWVVMGAGWVSELLSTIVSDPQWLWNIVDLINQLQGVFIFLILVVKPKLYYVIRKRLGLSRTPINTRLEKPDAQKNATSSSGRTSSTFLSRTISSDERANLRISAPQSIK
ncbi:unnamed protein product [Colias eurytheme]|nr:unnamed protein product [Colias eurytheme]